MVTEKTDNADAIIGKIWYKLLIDQMNQFVLQNISTT